MIDVGSRIKRYRLRRRWTQAELADRLGLVQPYVAALEANTKRPSLEMLEKVAAALRVAPWRLIK